ncbi:uncharacterized protein LOC126560022 [Anopheles maculipalpis]|uniref:uncharacterized protein LOC126560022 n=1 Tax=Anopheles maculipalpis TaxID=1496333 RepID=UPI002158D4EC|nr:uncharacterized protein LOC126560022 [Anopheles maculipalpis]
MASAIDKRPNLRISDVEELMRETGMDQSDTGIGIVNYFRRRQADFHRGRLFDGSDNQINFRLDNLQPVQHQPAQSQPLAASTDDAENSANVAMEAEAAVVLVRPLSELSVADSRVPLFVSAGRAASNSPARSTSRPLTSTVCSPPGRSTVHVSPMVSMSNRKSSNNLQRELVLQKHKRENQMKMEFLRNTASQLASSTPIAGERSERRGENLLDLRETISPIHEDTVQTTPVHATRPVSGVHREKQVSPSGPSTTHARAIRTPIPATQDAPDGMDRAGRETTPPPQLNENGVVVVPETPSPVRKSSRIPNTPLSGLSLTKRTSHLAIPGVLAYLGKGKSPRTIEVRSSAPSTPSRSILKNRTSRLNSTKHRVSFSEQLFVVRESPPSSKSSHMTSDEDEVQDIVNDPANPVQERAGDGEENAQQLRELFRVSRSNAVEEWDENALQETPERHNNRTNGDAVNMIMDDWNETESRRMELNEPQEDRELPVAQRTINNSIAITNIDTPRTVMMDIFDPPSAFCDVDEPALEVPPSQEPSQSRKRKAEEEGGIGGDGNDDNDSSSSARRSSIHENNDQMPRVSPRKICKPTSNVTINNTHHTERLMSVDSPNDHVPLDMIQAVDMIHSRVNSELGVNPGGARELADERRITLNIPSKRRTIKTKVHPDAELYIKTIENACSQERITNHQRKDRRKLFAHQMSEAQKENEADDEPQPLPATQDTVDSVVQADNQQNQLLYGLKSLIVPVQRLSLNTINRAINPDVVDTKEMDINAQREQAAIESPIQEKQNEEQNEKGDRPKRIDRGEQNDESADEEWDRPAKGKSKGKSKSKNNAKKKKQSRKSDVMFDKYLKNISNEIRHQIESEGPRRSHRNRRLAAEILRNNPNTLQTDAPKYVMPTIKDVLKYYQLSVKPSSKSKSKGQTSSKTANHKESEIVKKSKENVPPTVTLPDGEKKPKTRGRPKKDPRTEPEMFDADGFRVPPIPMGDAIPGSSSAVECSEMVDSSSPNLPPGVSIDSGLSSAVMTGDDAPTKMKKRTKISSKQHTAADQQEPCCSYDSSSLNPPTTREVMDEKRKTLDWMMMLMEKQPYRPPALPMVEVQGFTHLSLEHLVFHEKDGIGYSFYVYSNGDNFGFLRFPPNTSKRSTRTRGCSLKFLILSGSADFSINEVRVTAVGGDFLMIPLDSSYYIVNGPATTLMFMIKSSADLRLSENTVG